MLALGCVSRFGAFLTLTGLPLNHRSHMWQGLVLTVVHQVLCCSSCLFELCVKMAVMLTQVLRQLALGHHHALRCSQDVLLRGVNDIPAQPDISETIASQKAAEFPTNQYLTQM